MHADHYLEIGSTHSVCQDYALSGSKNALTWAIVSDGCSSSKDTDFGSRILAHAAKDTLLSMLDRGRFNDSRFMQDGAMESEFYDMVLDRASNVRALLHLDYNALDATLLTAFAFKKDQTNCLEWRVLAIGDGTIVFKHLDPSEHFSVIHLSYESNAPYYMSYNIRPERDVHYRASFTGGLKMVTTESFHGPNGVITTEPFSKDPCQEYSYVLDSVGFDSVSQIILFSDGLDSYRTKESASPFGTDELVRRVTGYKSIAGEFVQRRMRAFRKECDKADISHYDDVSCAAITIAE